MKFRGIPTVYNWRRCRSRLEARWAVMFDMLEWQAEYEPFDCDGWIPDFAIRTPAELPLLVEVKPIWNLDVEVTNKIDRAAGTHEVLLLGLAPLLSEEFESPMIGWLREFNSNGDYAGWWQDALLGRWKRDKTKDVPKDYVPKIGFCAAYGSYHDRITGLYDGSYGYGVEQDEMDAMWAEAGNRTQWRRA